MQWSEMFNPGATCAVHGLWSLLLLPIHSQPNFVHNSLKTLSEGFFRHIWKLLGLSGDPRNHTWRLPINSKLSEVCQGGVTGGEQSWSAVGRVKPGGQIESQDPKPTFVFVFMFIFFFVYIIDQGGGEHLRNSCQALHVQRPQGKDPEKVTSIFLCLSILIECMEGWEMN